MDEVKVKSLYKAVKLLDFFTVDFPERGISELSELAGLGKSTIHNIVTTFEKAGFLEKNPQNNKYRLGAKILQLSSNLYMTNDLRKIINPFMKKICSFSSESVYLATLFELEVLYLDAVYPTEVFSGRSIIGVKAPLYCTGVGKAIMANLSSEEIEIVIGKGLHSFTPNTFVNREELLEELALTKERGYAIDNMEHEYGIKCVAVPIRNIKGNVIGSISVSGPSLRFTDDKIEVYSHFLKETCDQLSTFLQ